MANAPEAPVVLFDGVCNLCNASVRFVLDRERDRRLRFASLQSEAARRILAPANVTDTRTLPDSIVLVDDEGVHTRSTAALRVSRHLRAPWRWLSVFAILPRSVRDALYDFVARHRYRFFGRQDRCGLPRPEHADRFLEDGVEPIAQETPPPEPRV